MILLVVLGVIALFVAFLFLTQRKQIYFPRPYTYAVEAEKMSDLVEISYETEFGAQTAFYYVPDGDPKRKPDELWVVFGGNAMLAVEWTDWLADLNNGVANPKENQRGFLLVEYPGYGLNEGKPTRESIVANAEAAVPALARHLDVSPDSLGPVNVLGLSLGTAAGMEFAVRHPVDEVILLAPFTSLFDMARRQFGPLAHLVLDRFDSRARLAELAGRDDRPEVVIVHGHEDRVVPFRMGRDMARDHPDWIKFIEIPDAGHNNILDMAETEIKSEIRN